MSPPCCPRHLIPITPSTDEVDAQRKEAIKAKVGAGVPHAGRWEQAQGEGQGGCDVQNRSFLSVTQLGVGLVLLRPWRWKLGRVGAGSPSSAPCFPQVAQYVSRAEELKAIVSSCNQALLRQGPSARDLLRGRASSPPLPGLG